VLHLAHRLRQHPPDIVVSDIVLVERDRGSIRCVSAILGHPAHRVALIVGREGRVPTQSGIAGRNSKTRSPIPLTRLFLQHIESFAKSLSNIFVGRVVKQRSDSDRIALISNNRKRIGKRPAIFGFLLAA